MSKDNFANSNDALCFSRLLHLLRAYVPTQSLFSGNTLATVSAEPLNKFGLFVQCNKYLLMVTCTLLCIRRLNFAQQLSYQLPLVCQLYVRSPSANYVCQSCYLLVFLSTKSLSLRIRTQIGSRVYKSRSPLRMRGITVVLLPPR